MLTVVVICSIPFYALLSAIVTSFLKRGLMRNLKREQILSVYLVKLEITETPDGINIFSGLSGSIEIKTDKRTVMEYFLEPIIKGFGESLKEK
jgi:hypothetical protein